VKNHLQEILIYLDEGVSRRSFRHTLQGIRADPNISLPVKSVNAKGIIESEWEKRAALLIFPGGYDVPYHTLLQGEANRRIREFVEKGGNYIGICAGAYYASSLIVFEKEGPLEVKAERELSFFPGTASGPVYGPDQFSYTSEKGSLAALIDWGDEELLSLYYKGGCTFEEAEKYPDVSILARYADLPSQPPALIHCSVGKGQALLSGIHPEFPASSLNPEDPYLKPLIPVLQRSEEARSRFFNHFVNLILI